MRFITTKTHGILDYVIGILLIAAPWILGFANQGPATYVPVVLGVAVILYSLFTDYEVGAVRAIPMTGHLWMDAIGGIILAASPWLFGFADYVYWPHLIVGLGEVAAAITTQTQPRIAAHHGRHHQATPGA